MRILYLGKICDHELYKIRESKQQPYFVAQFMFEKALYDELKKHNKISVEGVSIYQTEYFPNDNFIFRKKRSKIEGFKYLTFINVPYLRELSYFISTCFNIMVWNFKTRGKEEKCIYSSCHFPPVSLAVVMMSKLLSIKKVITFTDLSLFTYSEDKIKKMKKYKKILIKPYVSLVNKLQQSYDAYILFSEGMKDVVNPLSKPYLVMEGIFNGDNLNLTQSKEKSNAIAHAGTLNREVGIDKLLDVFSLVEDESIELWLFGKGDMVEEIIERAKSDKRIKYYGFMPRNDVFEKLKEAKLLINLRDPKDKYTKYSFPSKMFEYMVSGTPVLTTILDGIPDEYNNYVYTAGCYNNAEIARKIIEIFSLEDKHREELGKKAREFILNNKNSAEQVKLITKFLFRL